MKNTIAFVLIVGAIVLVVYTVINQTRRARSNIVVKEEFATGQVSQEVSCDNCGAISEGLTINRAHSQKYQVCPKCKQNKARPIVYFFCQNPGCHKALVKVRNVVVEDHQVLPGDTPVCPVCGREDMLTPMEIELSTAQRIAKETGQQFP
jgi:RNA polymerase subunit RPABC4/transcription elongation factor Spt4